MITKFEFIKNCSENRQKALICPVFLFKSGVNHYKLSSKPIQYPEHFQTITQLRNIQ